MKIDIKDVIDGSMNGEIVWICDYRHNDINDKPIRKIEPIKVIIRSTDEIKNRVYYSNSFFSKIGKNEKPQKSSIIKVYDNTGFRSYPGEPVHVFTDEKECREFYLEQFKIVRDMLAKEIENMEFKLIEMDNFINEQKK